MRWRLNPLSILRGSVPVHPLSGISGDKKAQIIKKLSPANVASSVERIRPRDPAKLRKDLFGLQIATGILSCWMIYMFFDLTDYSRWVVGALGIGMFIYFLMLSYTLILGVQSPTQDTQQDE